MVISILISHNLFFFRLNLKWAWFLRCTATVPMWRGPKIISEFKSRKDLRDHWVIYVHLYDYRSREGIEWARSWEKMQIHVFWLQDWGHFSLTTDFRTEATFQMINHMLEEEKVTWRLKNRLWIIYEVNL